MAYTALEYIIHVNKPVEYMQIAFLMWSDFSEHLFDLFSQFSTICINVFLKQPFNKLFSLSYQLLDRWPEFANEAARGQLQKQLSS